ncbi:hypothetical protein UFOVP462_12 [uncultured Caudovirales phage]|uniref:DUF1566 domain-containing protein n=1 Tax=uncultured Caudovirales phage TaxID=2100421 RepID=A0A6J5MFB3_9CAUD|nr:hypothetical protein UFOVP462_12 [uncultured Caudovirales phage]
MAEHKVQGGDMLLFIDPDGGTDYNIVVCLTSVGKSDSITVVDASSACGPDKSPGTLELSYSFEGQHLQDPVTGSISGTDLRILLRGEQTIGWMIAPETPVAGDEIESGTGYLSELSSTYAFDSVGTFTGTIQPYGTPTLSISGGGGGGLAVGQAYQGGTIAYLNEAGDHGIIIAWNDQDHQNIWGGSGVIGASVNSLYGGLTNTNLIEGAWATSAGWDTRQLTTGGYTDWCLPTIVDWDNIVPNCGILGINTFGTYWTSVEVDANSAYQYEPSAPGATFDLKSNNWEYIAVRYF